MSNCLYDPSPLINVPLGMFHCPGCGEMVIAGMPHPDYSILDDDEQIKIELEKTHNDTEMPMQSSSPGQDPWSGEQSNESNKGSNQS